MKITGIPHSTAIYPGNSVTSKPINLRQDSDLKPSSLKPRRKTRSPSVTRLKRPGAPAGWRSRPETPLLKWKIADKGRNVGVSEDEEVELKDEDKDGEKPDCGGRKTRRRSFNVVSVRKLAAGLWRLQLPETVATRNGERREDRPGACLVDISFVPHHNTKLYGSEVKGPLHSPSSVCGARNGLLCKLEPSFPFSNPAMEGATKWAPVCLEASDEVRQMYSQMKRLDQQVSTVSVVSALEAELEQAGVRIQELETERRSSKKKLEQFLKKVSEERAAWRSREHEKIRAFVDDIKADLNRERKSCQRLEIVNSKLLNELADVKVSARRYMQDYEKERKARELIEEVCDELAKEIGEDKSEVEALKRESMKLREEVDEERKMLQMAEVWREERVQMKLVDAKVALEEKYSQMNNLVAQLETFLMSKSLTPDLKERWEAESLVQAAASVHVQEIKEFAYDPPNPDDILSVFEDVNFGEANEREIEPCVAYSPVSHASKIHTVSPEVNVIKKDGNHIHSDTFVHQNGDVEEEEEEEYESGWETVSHLEDQGSSYSQEGSAPSVNKHRRDSNVSGSGTEWGDETPITEVSELCSMPTRQLKKVSSIARLWRSGPNNGDNYKIISLDGMNRLSNGRRSSNGCTASPDRGSSKGGLSPPDLGGQWSSPDSVNPHITRGMKGCIEWPRGQKNSLKAKLLEARMESQKVQLRHVLKQKI